MKLLIEIIFCFLGGFVAVVICSKYDAWQKYRKKLRKYEEMEITIERRIIELRASSNYPHNFKGQMVEDFEWVLSLLN